MVGQTEYYPDNESQVTPVKQNGAIVAEVKDDAVNHPSHYGGDQEHEVIKCLAAWGLEANALLWNVAKYVSRAGKKDPRRLLEDLRKARFYLNREISKLEAEENAKSK